MRSHQIMFPDSLWEQAKRKAGLTSLSAIVRKLVELWLAGKIDLNQ
jgi:hypothetical protein